MIFFDYFWSILQNIPRTQHKLSGPKFHIAKSIRDRENACSLIAWKNSAKTTDTPTSGSSGQKPRLTREWKTVRCKTGQFRTSCRSRVIHQFWKRFVLDKPPQDSSSSSSSPVLERSDGVCHRKLVRSLTTPKQKQKRDDRRDSDDRRQDLLESLEEFGDNLEDTELPGKRTHFSGLRFGTSNGSGIKIKEATVILLTSQKTENCEVCFANQSDKGSLQKADRQSSTSFGDLITADHKLFNERSKSRDNHWYAVVVQQSWLLSGFNLIRAKTKTSQETQETEKELAKVPGTREEA